MNQHQDPALRGHWKIDSQGNRLQWIPNELQPPAKAKKFWRRLAIELFGYWILVSAGATIVFYALKWATERR